MITIGSSLVLDRLKGPDHINFRVWYLFPSFDLKNKCIKTHKKMTETACKS